MTMGPFPNQVIEPLVTIHPWSLEAIGPDLISNGLYFTACTSKGWEVPSAALLIPFTLTKQIKVVEGFWYNGATVAYNVDVGVYDTSGNLLCHTGSVVSSGSNVLQIAAITPTTFGPGNFYIAMVAPSSSQTFFALNTANAQMLRAFGCAYIPSPILPLASATLSSVVTFTAVPIFGVSTRSVL